MKNNNWYNIKACEIADPYYGYIEEVIIGSEEDVLVAVELLVADGYEIYVVEKWED